MSCWTDRSWLAEARAWIHAQLECRGTPALGEIEQIHVTTYSTVLRVATEPGAVFFKANGAALRHEAAVVSLLAERRGDCVPAPLACDLERGWMLMRDAGVRLRELIRAERQMTRWLEVLPLYAGVQIDLAGDADALVGLGMPDLRLSRLTARYERLLDELEVEGVPAEELRRLRRSIPRVSEMCLELAGYGVPETIQHDDLDDEQVFIRDGRYLLLDWGDACVSHPFFSLSVTLEGVIAWGVDDVRGTVGIEPFRDAYLAPFARDLSQVDLVAACSTALRLGWVCRAVNVHASQALPRAPERTLTRLHMFLDDAP